MKSIGNQNDLIPGVSIGTVVVMEGKEGGFVLIHFTLALCRKAYRFLTHKREVFIEF